MNTSDLQDIIARQLKPYIDMKDRDKVGLLSGSLSGMKLLGGISDHIIKCQKCTERWEEIVADWHDTSLSKSKKL